MNITWVRIGSYDYKDKHNPESNSHLQYVNTADNYVL